ncbi:putative membrane protein [Acidovorax sp. 107]|uniref:DUF1003 domain-containing protein n=1 Tax=Acidovorax sp. 107 TaxID=2135638 RepID=UPI000D442AA3|nr:DUF1003 domain-containing protein [Acidovorax sp. 107]PUA95303.1 putative membrane protein [Acidovorax sp. 107]
MGNVNDHITQVTHQNIENILCAEDDRRKQTQRPYRAIAKVTQACGTVGFLVLNAVLFIGWIVVNEFIVRFDPFPYTLLLFWVSLEAIFLSVFILISQNMAAAESERRHHLDLQMNLLSEREITALMRLALDISEKVGVPDEKTEEVRAFAHETDPSGVLNQIIRAEHRHRVVVAGESRR